MPNQTDQHAQKFCLYFYSDGFHVARLSYAMLSARLGCITLTCMVHHFVLLQLDLIQHQELVSRASFTQNA